MDFFIIIFFLLLLLLNLPTSRTQEEDTGNCQKHFKCGLLDDLSYPFWGGNRSSTCGHPDFMLNCEESKYPLMAATQQQFRVLKVNRSSSSMTVARDDYFSNDEICKIDPSNITLEATILSYNPSGFQNISIFYNCTQKIVDHVQKPFRFTCSGDGFLANEGFLMSDLQYSALDLVENCETRVEVPIQTKVVEKIKSFSVETMLEGLREGFNVSYGYDCLPCLSSGGSCVNINGSGYLPICDKKFKRKHSDVRMKAIIGVIVLVGSLVILSITFCLYKIFVKCKFNKENDEDIETFISNHGALAMKRYRYKEIKKITNSFSEKLGEGGFGSVYKGKLSDGRVVAVKVLKLSEGNGGEFLNEVANISRTSHVNVVTLLGYCFESNKRVLIFEFMSNGSLDKFIRSRASCSGTGIVLAWQKLYEIAIGVARGLEYLHRGCNTRIVHFDIKPHNILLDDDFLSKISDFGLAKLTNARESIMSSMMEARGTIGYIAPEVFNRNFGNVSSKSDVYSYGMLLLDIIGARQRDHTEVDDADGTGSSLCYFPNGIYKQVELEKYDLYGSLTMEEAAIVKRMTLIGLWCIQMIPSSRPTMSKVIEMLEGSMEALETPPKPFLFSPPRLPVASSATSTTETG